MREGEKKDALAKAEAAAEKRVIALIENLQLLDHRSGRIAYGLTERAQENLRKLVIKSRERGSSFQDIAKDVTAKIADLYETAEKQAERSLK